MSKKKGIQLTDHQRLNWLRLMRSENVGSITFRNLIDHYGSAENALSALPDISMRGGKKIRIASLDDAKREFERADKLGIRFIAIGEPDYPPLLRNIEGPPPLISVKGNVEIFQRPSVGIVGSRNASAVGKKITTQFAVHLGLNDYSIVSGLARGIDAIAHQSSLTTGTIAIMAGGIDQIYPAEHQKLYNDILEYNGAIISEMPIGWQPRNVDFPRRNRIVAGLSMGLLVVEAAMRSGSLITARLANEMGRLVFAIPGSPLDPRAAGTNNIIKQGALLVTTPTDIIESLAPLSQQSSPSQLSFLEASPPMLSEFPHEKDGDCQYSVDSLNEKNDQTTLLSSLSTTPIDLETLSLHSGIPLQKLYLLLIELDLSGKLTRHDGGYVSLLNDH